MPRPLACFALLLVACDRVDPPAPAPPVSPTAAEVVPASAPPPAEPATPPAAPERVPTFAAAPSRAMPFAKAFQLDAETRVGLRFGLPTGWREEDPSYLLMYPARGDTVSRAAVVRLDAPGLDAPNRRQLLERAALPLGARAARWQPWEDDAAGPARIPAVAARGTGRAAGAEVDLLAVVVALPDTRAAGFVAAWPAGDAALEATALDAVRHVRRCRVQVGLGCVEE
jgi:hypothetical protein